MAKLSLKVCGMKYPENIEGLSEILPEYMGFIFYEKSPRFAGIDLQSDQLKRIPVSIKKVGVFVNASTEEMSSIAGIYGFTFLQLHGEEPASQCKKLKELGFKIIKAFSIDNTFDFGALEAYKPYCDFFLFDTKSDQYGGTGKTFDWSILQRYDNAVPFFLSGGIEERHLQEIEKLTGLNIHAVDVNSKFELIPGKKDLERIRLFKQALARITNKKEQV